MKCKLFLFLLLIGLLGCSKDGELTKDEELEKPINYQEILGKWTWIESSGGYAGTIVTPKILDVNFYLSIKEKEIEKYKDGKLLYSHPYIVDYDLSICKEKIPLIIYEDEDVIIPYKVEGDTLILYGKCADFTVKYVRRN
ncbi:MAG: hypothetical protein ABFR62_12110 [Bacteroidota bacterium]